MVKYCWKCQEYKEDKEFIPLHDKLNYRYKEYKFKRRDRCRDCRCQCAWTLKGKCMRCGKVLLG